MDRYLILNYDHNYVYLTKDEQKDKGHINVELYI